MLLVILYYAQPRVYILYSKDGNKNISYILNTEHRFVKGDLLPDRTTGDVGPIFASEKFFMEFYWWGDNERRHCISITPKWPTTEIHLDHNGNIDIRRESETDVDSLKECQFDWAKP
ncbi:hypothetical protein AUC61_03320 [Pseudomonas sp. S25]|uniref:Uncharacterized protein n=1 Tax=Pseudomonas maioricensis TaxID=1766623 RepID=A0ABS9ZDT0_9PSED|nr:hypothetical protein [Pseudomonas sp. S25]